jgi:uncharacterized Rossmann fold enzyme
MDFEVWEPYYLQILSDFKFSHEDDKRSAEILSELMVNKNMVTEPDFESLIYGKDVIVVGGAKNLEDELKQNTSGKMIIAADGTTSTLLKKDLIPDIIVTDLDGNIDDQISANSKGAIVAIHAHGDNISQIKLWTQKFEGKVIGTSQCKPPKNLYNFGGFTDGDRSVFLAHHFGAGSIRLMGFDFENVGEKPKCDEKTKLEKLQWAKKLILLLGVEVG